MHSVEIQEQQETKKVSLVDCILSNYPLLTEAIISQRKKLIFPKFMVGYSETLEVVYINCGYFIQLWKQNDSQKLVEEQVFNESGTPSCIKYESPQRFQINNECFLIFSNSTNLFFISKTKLFKSRLNGIHQPIASFVVLSENQILVRTISDKWILLDFDEEANETVKELNSFPNKSVLQSVLSFRKTNPDQVENEYQRLHSVCLSKEKLVFHIFSTFISVFSTVDSFKRVNNVLENDFMKTILKATPKEFGPSSKFKIVESLVALSLSNEIEVLLFCLIQHHQSNGQFTSSLFLEKFHYVSDSLIHQSSLLLVHKNHSSKMDQICKIDSGKTHFFLSLVLFFSDSSQNESFLFQISKDSFYGELKNYDYEILGTSIVKERNKESLFVFSKNSIEKVGSNERPKQTVNFVKQSLNASYLDLSDSLQNEDLPKPAPKSDDLFNSFSESNTNFSQNLSKLFSKSANSVDVINMLESSISNKSMLCNFASKRKPEKIEQLLQSTSETTENPSTNKSILKKQKKCFDIISQEIDRVNNQINEIYKASSGLQKSEIENIKSRFFEIKFQLKIMKAIREFHQFLIAKKDNKALFHFEKVLVAANSNQMKENSLFNTDLFYTNLRNLPYFFICLNENFCEFCENSRFVSDVRQFISELLMEIESKREKFNVSINQTMIHVVLENDFLYSITQLGEKIAKSGMENVPGFQNNESMLKMMALYINHYGKLTVDRENYFEMTQKWIFGELEGHLCATELFAFALRLI